MFHAAAAMLKIAELEYNGANSVFLRALIDKKFALPYKAIDAIVSHFLRMKNDEREMPVLWHQCLLAVCQRYKNDLNPEQKSAILDLIRFQSHYLISPEIRRELESKDTGIEGSQSASKIEIVKKGMIDYVITQWQGNECILDGNSIAKNPNICRFGGGYSFFSKAVPPANAPSQPNWIVAAVLALHMVDCVGHTCRTSTFTILPLFIWSWICANAWRRMCC
ncbi:hypothetical protein OESDEN_11027 [Oesophagostomum dentatum]|uniref:Bystin n=1 Tax=Oesophagostomum dentatum TaxID=61180 RepID=A0A0B1T087_OESDE|nr:hypothetical protein OESDEN_11027 [Oesophagostomum dentatum]